MVNAITGFTNIDTAYLVEDGPQVVSKRIPEQVARTEDGIPRMGYQPLPADYAFQEYMEARSIQARTTDLSWLGHEVDLFG